MAQLDKLETALDDTLNKKAPFKIPENGRKSLARAMWWLALIFGVLQLWAAWAFWNAAHVVNRLADSVNSFSALYGGEKISTSLGFFFYLSLVVLLVSAVLVLLATPHLKDMRKAGWNLVFYSLLVNVAYGVVVLFADYGGFGNFIWAMLSSLVGAYLLFQIRDQFMKSHHKS
jgi:hypothetical protein